ncbi:MAG: hypothetical protein AAES65_16180 [Candidatus Thiodiazotropha sp. (ex. Lucinoma kazani)]
MRNRKWGKMGFLGLLAALPLSVSAGTEVYVPLGSANAIAVVDAESDQIVAEILGIIASHGLAVSVDGKLLLAGSLMERPIGAVPTKPQDMSDKEHAAHHSNGEEVSLEKNTKVKTVGTAYLIDAMERRLLRQIDVPGAVHHALGPVNTNFVIILG